MYCGPRVNLQVFIWPSEQFEFETPSLKDADQWQSHSQIWCRFVYTICVVEISVDGSIVVLTIGEHVA